MPRRRQGRAQLAAAGLPGRAADVVVDENGFAATVPGGLRPETPWCPHDQGGLDYAVDPLGGMASPMPSA